MSESASPRPRCFAPHLQPYDFECIGPLWVTSFQPEPAIYALVAPRGIRRYDEIFFEQAESVVSEIRPADNDEKIAIAPSEIFYIGSTGNLYSRFANYKTNVSKRGGPTVLSLLRDARRQNVPIDVYVRRVAEDRIILHGLPVDLLRGCEAGLIRELTPYGNSHHR